MINYKNYRARLVEEKDLDFLTDLRTSEFVQNNVGNVILTNKILQLDWLNHISKSKTDNFLILEVKKNDSYERIGMIRLSDIDRVHRNMCVGGDIAEEHSGKGHGKFMYELIFKLGFEIWGMHRLWLFVLENNQRAKNLYKKVGFIEEGRQRQGRFKNGQYVDYIMMSILEDEYKKLKS